MDNQPILKLVSIVIPIYNEEKSVQELYDQIKTTLVGLHLGYEIIFVDDGSQDKTCEVLKNLHALDSKIKIIKLARNYGQNYALLAGFDFVKGDIIIVMDADLQNSPRDIPLLLQGMTEGSDFVTGWRYSRQDSIIRKIISLFANYVIKLKTGVKLYDYGCAFIATTPDIIKKLKRCGSQARFIKPVIAGLASSVCEVKVSHYRRSRGMTKYGFLKIMKLGLDFLVNFSSKVKSADTLIYHVVETIGI